ncbi:hypothetical protein [Xanthomonas sp. MUS 060]|uniref:hypothetical protein n=1 Tax=Xanthomonas sp. MUS 060 TaxID=1588031 RepID=UPI00126A4493|nr:hypothetical protein [Xanthomonas sp. MUS 060]
MQALDTTGTNAKPITGANGQAKALTPITIGNAANLQALIDCSVDELDTNNGYAFVQLQITLSSVGPIAGLLLGINPRFEPASALNAASVLLADHRLILDLPSSIPFTPTAPPLSKEFFHGPRPLFHRLLPRQRRRPMDLVRYFTDFFHVNGAGMHAMRQVRKGPDLSCQ